MNDFLAALLQAVIIAAVPVCAAFIGKGLKALAAYLGQKSENETAKKYLAETAEAVSTAVTFTSQTYVDELKKSGKFDKEAQDKALFIAIEAAKNLLTGEAREFLKDAYGLDWYLKGHIEAEVRRQKLDQPAALALPIVSETATDTTALATSTAAATAASVAQSAISQMSAEILPGTPLE